ncbi:MAG: HAMP domain-containing sensor histidine kinase, partial [Cryomorphaceae bacterium]
EVRSGGPGKVMDTLIEREDVRLDEVLEMERSGRLRQLLERIQVENIKQEDGWTNRIDSAAIEQKLRENITEKAITVPFAFAVTNQDGEAFQNLRSRNYQGKASVWASAPLFPADLRSKDVVLNVQLDAGISTLFKEIGWLTFLSLLFTLTMLLLFVLLWRQLLSQTKLSQMKTDFIGNMSHELRTPLATISLAADSINHPKTSANPTAIKPLIETIKREHDRILRHVDRVLQMAHAGQGGFPLERTSLDLPSWVEQIVSAYEDRAKSEGKELTFHCDGEEARVEWDDLHVRSAIENLLDNALNYNPAGTNVLLQLSMKPSGVEITVKDDGVGISEDEQHLVFERFYRVQRGNLHEVKGFGLGLNYVQLVCEAHKGSLSLVSSRGKGAAFTMKLPKHG